MKTLFTMLIAVVASAAAATAEVPYLTGGIGQYERESILAQKTNYNLEIKAALKTGHYVSEVHYRITSKEGAELLSANADGPLFFVNLPVGSYSITASYEGQSSTQNITIPASGLREVMFRFDGNEEVIKEAPALR